MGIRLDNHNIYDNVAKNGFRIGFQTAVMYICRDL